MKPTKLIEKLEKEFDVLMKGMNLHCACNDDHETYRNFIRSHLPSLLQAVGEEIIIDWVKEYVEWRKYVEGEYEAGRKDKKSRTILPYQEWLYNTQRSRLKEIIQEVGK